MDMQAKPGARPSPASVWQLAWPAVVTNLLQSLVGLVDAWAVGTLGPAAVAAATAGHRLFFVLQTVLMAVVAGTTALVARASGAGDRDEAARVLGGSLVLGCAIAAVMTGLGVAAADPFAAALGLRGEPARLAAIYIRWISWFNVAVAFGFVLGTGLRAAGDTRTPLLVGVVSNVVNLLLLYVLVYGGLGVRSIGIAGAALAGGLSFTTGGALVGVLWLRRKLLVRPLRTGVLDRRRMRQLVAIGYPSAIEQAVFQAGFIGFTFIIARFYGTSALAAYGIGVAILSLSFVVGFGFSIAASTLVGQHLGAGEPARATSSGWRALALALATMSVLSLLIVAAARPIAELMISDAEVVRLTVAFIYLLGAAQPLMAVEFALGGALRGAGDTRFPLLTTFAGLIGGRLVLAVVFTWVGLPVEWVYGALLADYTVKSILLVSRFRSGRWQHALAARVPAQVATSSPPPDVAA